MRSATSDGEGCYGVRGALSDGAGGYGVRGALSDGAGVTGVSVLSFRAKRKDQRKAKVGGMLPPKGGRYFLFVHELFLILSP